MSSSPSPSPAPYRLLIVDGEATIRELLGEVLAEEGVCPTLVADLPSALAALDRERFDVILADTLDRRGIAPPFDRWATLEALRARARSAPLLIFSAHPASAFAEARARGFAGFIAKPFDLDTLARIVRRCAEADRRDRQRAAPTLVPT
jgi:DNA-binding NtrC family response regulator